jgi:TRAP-type C4-dicarboxylate transport system substrate-binding protein
MKTPFEISDLYNTTYSIVNQAIIPANSTLARGLLAKDGSIPLRADDLALSLTNLLASTGAAAAISTLITGSDLTASGALTTLATNVGTNTTQGATLFTALVARATAANAVAIKTLGDTVQAVTPLTGATVTAAITGVNETAYITPAGTIAALTYVFPSDSNSRIGQVLRAVSTQTVTALTVSSAGLTLLGTAVTALVANTPVSFQKVAASTWLRLK